MTTNANESAATPAAAAKPKTVADDMAARRCFYPNESGTALEQAVEYLGQTMERVSDFDSFPFAAPGVGADEDGNTTFDESIYTDSRGVMIGTLKETTGTGTNRARVVKAIFMVPIPNLQAMAEAATEDELARKWIQGILEKEANHVAVRPLRDADKPLDVVDQMPTDEDAYTNSGRAAGAGIMGTYNELYKGIIATLAGKIPAFAKARFIKSELKKAMESRAYALEYFGALEDRGEKESLLVLAINLGINSAKKKGLDPAIFERWLATRDAKVLTVADEEEADDFDLDALTADLLTDDKPEAPADGEATDSDDADEGAEADDTAGE